MITTIAEATGMPHFLLMALMAGTLVGALASFYGVFVVQRGLGFLGSGLSHAAFGGVALGIMLGVDPLLTAMPFTVAVAFGIVWLREHSRLATDTIIGIFFSVSMALGVILLARTPRYSTDAFTYLFGSVLAVHPTDLWAAVGATALTLLFAPVWKRWAYATFDRELAGSDRVPLLRDDYLLAALLAIVIVSAMKVVGMVLVAAFLVIPPAAARLVVRTFSGMTICSLIFGITSVGGGLWLAWQADLPAGASIILVQTATFLGAFVVGRIRG